MNTISVSKLSLQFFLLGFLVAFALGLNYLSAWTGPTAAAPNDNVAAPLNTGTANQVKNANLSVGRSTNTASDFGLISYGKIRSTIGGVQFPDNSVQTSAATTFDPSLPLALGSTLSVQGDTTLRSRLGFAPGTGAASVAYAIDMGALPVASTNGIRFADGTVQTTADSGAVGSLQFTSVSCSGTTDRYGAGTCTATCPTGYTASSCLPTTGTNAQSITATRCVFNTASASTAFSGRTVCLRVI
jgi:hypothetical protein